MGAGFDRPERLGVLQYCRHDFGHDIVLTIRVDIAFSFQERCVVQRHKPLNCC